MKKKTLIINLCAFVMFFSVLLWGCAKTENVVIPTPTSTNTYPIQTPIKVLAPTSAAAPTITQAPKATPTIQPTYTLLESKEKALDLLKANGGCDFPCVWGIMPGITSKPSISGFVSRFGKGEIKNDFYVNSQELFLGDDSRQSLTWMFGKNSVYMNTVYVTSNSTLKWIGIHMEIHQNNILLESGFPEDMVQYYELSQVLTNYGIPSEILMFTNHDDPQSLQYSPPFSLVLIYSDQNFLVDFVFPRDIGGAYFIGCPSKTYNIDYRFWNPSEKTDISEIFKDEHVDADFYKHIEEVSSMSKEDFYQTFKDAEKGTCIKTEASKWPAIW